MADPSWGNVSQWTNQRCDKEGERCTDSSQQFTMNFTSVSSSPRGISTYAAFLCSQARVRTSSLEWMGNGIKPISILLKFFKKWFRNQESININNFIFEGKCTSRSKGIKMINTYLKKKNYQNKGFGASYSWFNMRESYGVGSGTAEKSNFSQFYPCQNMSRRSADWTLMYF